MFLGTAAALPEVLGIPDPGAWQTSQLAEAVLSSWHLKQVCIVGWLRAPIGSAASWATAQWQVMHFSPSRTMPLWLTLSPAGVVIVPFRIDSWQRRHEELGTTALNERSTS